MHLCAGDDAVAAKLKAFIEAHGVEFLDLAGPRVSKEPGVREFVMRILEDAVGKLALSDHC